MVSSSISYFLSDTAGLLLGCGFQIAALKAGSAMLVARRCRAAAFIASARTHESQFKEVYQPRILFCFSFSPAPLRLKSQLVRAQAEFRLHYVSRHASKKKGKHFHSHARSPTPMTLPFDVRYRRKRPRPRHMPSSKAIITATMLLPPSTGLPESHFMRAAGFYTPLLASAATAPAICVTHIENTSAISFQHTSSRR